MKGQLYINDKDAWVTWNARMIEDSLDNLELPGNPKENPSNDNELEDGESIYDLDYRESSRLVQLLFDFDCANTSDYIIKRRAFYTELKANKGVVKLRVPSLKVTYTLRVESYLNLTSGMRYSKGKLSVRFKEANIKDRIYV